jgi:hypothetical protein
MNESNEKKKLCFGRWADLDEWFNEASCVKEKTKPNGKIETISVFGNWCLRVYIPTREGDGYESAMEIALTLLAEVGTRPDDVYLERGYCVISLGSGEFYGMKALAEEIQRCLLSRAIRTTVGDSFPTASNDEICAHLRFEQDTRIVRAPVAKWRLTVVFCNGKRSAPAAANLLVELGLTPPRSHLEVGGFSVCCAISDFALAKSKASQTIAWLTRNGYEIQTSWGDVDLPLQLLDEESLIGLNETGDSFYRSDDSAGARVELRDAAHYFAEGDEEIIKLKRLQARLKESAEKVKVVLNRAQVNALLDLAGECLNHQILYSQIIDTYYLGDYHIEEEEWARYHEAGKLVAPLSELTQDLRNALRCAID